MRTLRSVLRTATVLALTMPATAAWAQPGNSSGNAASLNTIPTLDGAALAGLAGALAATGAYVLMRRRNRLK